MEKQNSNLKEKSNSETKEQIIARLLAKADLDFRCCGHGGGHEHTKS